MTTAFSRLIDNVAAVRGAILWVNAQSPIEQQTH
jgi:hypothetical protein